MKMKISAIVASTFLCALSSHALTGFTPDQVITYKTTAEVANLYLDVFTPPGHQATDNRAAVVFFHGGAWRVGDPTAFHAHCEYLASRGMVAISARYRLVLETEPTYNGNLPSTAPQKCVQDAKSAIRYLREHATELGIDPNRIAAGGGSAGGQMAAAAGTLSGYDEPGENLSISSKPDALVLYNPVYNNGPVNGWQYDVCINYWESFSPMNNITVNTPPTIVFLGTNDGLIPVSVAKEYKALMDAQGVRSDLHLYEGEGHGFFNYSYSGYNNTIVRTDQFLVSLGYLDPLGTSTAVQDWVTLYGDAAFSGGSEATNSPVTTSASQDCIAANIPPVTLQDGGFIQLTGTFTLNAPLASGNFQVGLFNGENPVAAGSGTGYTGFSASAPGTSNTALSYDYEGPQGDVTETFSGTGGASIIGTTTTTGGQTWQGVGFLLDNGTFNNTLGSAYFPFTAENGKQYQISLDVNMDTYTGANRAMNVGFFRQEPISTRHNSAGVGGAFLQAVPNNGLIYAKYNNAEQVPAAAFAFGKTYTMDILLTCAADGQSYTVDYNYTDQSTGLNTHMGQVTINQPISEMTHAGISGDVRNQPGFADNFLLTIDSEGSSSGAYPFDPARNTSMGTLAAAASVVPANTPVDFTLLISRKLDVLDVSALFTDNAGYHAAVNIVENAATSKYFNNGGCTLSFNTAAFMLSGGGTGTFSNVQVTRGSVYVPANFLQCNHSEGNLNFTWTSKEGHYYRLKGSDTLETPIGAWTDAVPAMPATAPANSKSMPLPAADRQFYVIEEYYIESAPVEE